MNNILASTRYGFIKGLSTKVIKNTKKSTKEDISCKIDCFLTNKFLGIPIFLIVAWIMFQATFGLSKPLISLI